MKNAPRAIAAAGMAMFLTLGVFAVDAQAGEPTGKSFEDIMNSIAAAGYVSNNDGHEWSFSKSGSGWKVRNRAGDDARVSSGGDDRIEIKGFPKNWGANGGYDFSVADGKCALSSDHSSHRLKWDCGAL